MKRRELVLAAMAAADGAKLTPVQAQKLFFLIDENLGEMLGGRQFDFKPYHYGPFDKAVYEEIDRLAVEGLAERVQDRRWTSYRLTPQGQALGEDLNQQLDDKAKDYVHRAMSFVCSLSFTDLVAAIYRAYPRMRENSVFQS